MKSNETDRIQLGRIPGMGKFDGLALGPWLLALGFLFFGVPLVAAEALNMDVSTPAIKKLEKAIAGRADRVKALKDKGYVGEARDGLLAVRSLKGVKLV